MFASVCEWVFCNVNLFYMFVGVSFFFRIKLHCFIELIEKHTYNEYLKVYRRWGAVFITNNGENYQREASCKEKENYPSFLGYNLFWKS